jgi:hypothetical protein
MSAETAAAWADMRDELQVMAADIGSTVVDAAEGLRAATQLIIASDDSNAEELARYLKNPNLHPTDAESNPPGAEDPGTPVLPR